MNDEQWFWEKCGLVDTFEGDTGAHYWKAPNGDAGVDLPPIDLNNLFKYAESELDKKGEWFVVFQKKWNDPSIKYATISYVDGKEYDEESNTFEDAFYQAIYKVFEAKDE